MPLSGTPLCEDYYIFKFLLEIKLSVVSFKRNHFVIHGGGPTSDNFENVVHYFFAYMYFFFLQFNSSIYSTNIKQFTKNVIFIVKYKIRFGSSKKRINACR